MKKILAALLGSACSPIRRKRTPVHDDSLRANQGERRPAFSYWRALVS